MRIPVLIAIAAALQFAVLAQPKYENNLENAEVGSVPEEFLVLGGDFTVQEADGNKFLELPGAPLETFGLLFGPAARENVAASARIFGTSKGRRYPAFDVGLNGAGGYKLRVSPAKKQLALYRGDDLKTAVPLAWKSGKWTHLELQVVKTGDKQWQIQGKVWQEGETEPGEPSLEFTDTREPILGRASVSGMPFSGQPIRFDDLVVTPAPAK